MSGFLLQSTREPCERLTVGLCNCRNKDFGNVMKRSWETEPEALAACEAYKRKYTDDPRRSLMKHYRCPEGNGFHIGHGRVLVDQRPNTGRAMPVPSRIATPCAQPPPNVPSAGTDSQDHAHNEIYEWGDLIVSTARDFAKQVVPVVERGSRTLLGWAINGLKASADYLSDVQKKLEQMEKK
jgi:hypothetical protein